MRTRRTKAPQAAGVTSTPTSSRLLKAEVTIFTELKTHKTEAAMREKGLLRIEGKDYVVEDGDVMHFRFNV